MEVKKIQRKFKKLFKFPKSRNNETFESLLQSLDCYQNSETSSTKSKKSKNRKNKRKNSKNSSNSTDQSNDSSSEDSSEITRSGMLTLNTLATKEDDNLVFNVSKKNRARVTTYGARNNRIYPSL